jgi:hypothetical protein
MDTNRQAILFHLKKGASLKIALNNPQVAFVFYPDEKYVPVNADTAAALIEEGNLIEVNPGVFDLLKIASNIV